MSSGTNPERLSQNNELLITNNEELVNLKTIIEALPETLDTTDATALATDIVIDKTAYVNGEKITGIVREAKANETVGTINMNATFYGDWGNGYRTLECRFEKDTLQRENSVISVPLTNPDMTIDLVTQMGITADKIAAGNTILGVEGTSAGLDTSDATATASDLAEGKTAYVGGEKITGNIYTVISGRSVGIKQETIATGWETPAGSTEKIPTITFRRKRTDDLLLKTGSTLEMYAYQPDVATKLGITSDMIVIGNTILGVEGTATELDVTKTEIWDTTNNDVQVGASRVEIISDRAVITLTTPIQGGITSKEQLLLSGTGDIMIETSINDSGCLCAKLIGIESLESYMAVSGEIVVVVDTEGAYLGTYQYNAGTWSEIVSSSAYNNTLTETEYDEAVETTHTILGEEEI